MSLHFSPIVFDFDGTLVDSASAIITSLQAAFTEHSLPAPTKNEIEYLIGIPLEAAIIKLLPGSHNTALVRDIINTYRIIYRDNGKDMIRAFPGVIDLLSNIKKLGAPIGIATSKKTSVAIENIDTSGLSSFIDFVAGSDLVKNHKPHPETLEIVLSKLGNNSKSKPIIIGDTTYDIEMGKNAGVSTCAVTWGVHSRNNLLSLFPNYTVNTVDELVGVLVVHGEGRG